MPRKNLTFRIILSWIPELPLLSIEEVLARREPREEDMRPFLPVINAVRNAL
jgi:hypothetical protein